MSQRQRQQQQQQQLPLLLHTNSNSSDDDDGAEDGCLEYSTTTTADNNDDNDVHLLLSDADADAADAVVKGEEGATSDDDDDVVKHNDDTINNDNNDININKNSSINSNNDDININNDNEIDNVLMTPISSKNKQQQQQRRLSSKLAERFSKFEGDSMSPLPPAISAILSMSNKLSMLSSGEEEEEELELSPLKNIMATSSNNNNSNNSNNSNTVPLSAGATARKRSIRDSLKGRVQVFDGSGGGGSSRRALQPQVLLSPREVRQLIVANANSMRIKGIQKHFENNTVQYQRDQIRETVLKKERQRRLKLYSSSSSCCQEERRRRRQQWETTRAAFENNSGDSSTTTTNYYHYQGASHIIHRDVHARPLDFSDFVPPQFGDKMTDWQQQRELILEMVDRNFVFTEFRVHGRARTEGSLEALIAAFEPVSYPLGHVLYYQTDNNNNNNTENENGNDTDNGQKQAFYIVQDGVIAFHADGVSVGAISTGCGFGEQSLLVPAPSTVTVSVALSSQNQNTSGNGAQLLKLDPHVYRGLLHLYSKKAVLEKKTILKQVDFLQDILLQDDENDSLLSSLASIMTRVECTEHQVFDSPEDRTFVVVQSGELTVRSNHGGAPALLTLQAGDYFGERALIGSLPRRSLVLSNNTTVTATSSQGAVFFKIDRVRMETILGPCRLQNLKDMYRLLHRTATSPTTSALSLSLSQRWKRDNTKSSKSSQSSWRQKKSSPREASQIIPHSLQAPDNRILTVDVRDKPAVYVVQQGSVTVSFENPDGSHSCQELQEGDVFGHEQLQTKDDKSREIYRTGGLQAEITKGTTTTATIGVLELDNSLGMDDESWSSQHTMTSGKSTSSSLSRNSTLALRDKIRTVVKDAITLADLEKLRLLGEGEFGEVWLVAADIFQGQEDSTNSSSLRQQFALKSQRKVDELRGKDAVEAIRREIDIMKALDHSQVVDLVQTFEDDGNLYMLMGLIPGGELWDRVYKESGSGEWSSGLSEEHAKFYSLVIADTLGFIHSRQYIYRDLKPENVMIDADGYPVIVDFGCSKYCPDTTFTFCGTPNYVAPEIIKNAGHNRCVDYWALGITIYEMITGENPFYFEGMDQVSLYDSICQEPHYALTTAKGHSSELIHLVDQLLEKDPINRLGMLVGGVDDILQHSWFDGLNLAQVRSKHWPAPWKPDRNEEDFSMPEGGLDSIPLPLVSTHSTDSADNIKFDMETSFASLAEEVIPEDDIFTELDGSGGSLDDDERGVATSSLKPKQRSSNKGASKIKKKSKSVPVFSGAQLAPDFQYPTASGEQKITFMENPKKKMTAEKRQQSKSRRSGIMDSLAGMGIDSDDEFQLY